MYIFFYFFFIFIQPVEFTTADAELLFGPDADYKAAFEELDTDEDGEVIKQPKKLVMASLSAVFHLFLEMVCRGRFLCNFPINAQVRAADDQSDSIILIYL